ncbi:MAG: hypothetical protein JRK53_17305 [Deltaproteobacteria bacterium]|nr:hypothetical protein [Deltaproteobacteria bacterium]MBW1817446.1 hypothetical protein [Deltaproteobacteria bacterium]
MVAVGSLDRVWLAGPEGVSEQELQDAFRTCFGAEWTEVLDAADISFAYNAANDAYLSVRDLRPVANRILDELLEKNGSVQPPNIIVS